MTPGDLLMSCAGGTVATVALDFDAIMAALGSDPDAATMSLQLKRQGRADIARHVIDTCFDFMESFGLASSLRHPTCIEPSFSQ